MAGKWRDLICSESRGDICAASQRRFWALIFSLARKSSRGELASLDVAPNVADLVAQRGGELPSAQARVLAAAA